MNAYATNYEQDGQGIDEAKILKLTSVFNNKNNLEFLLNKEKRFFKFANTELEFYVDLPGIYAGLLYVLSCFLANYQPENDLGAKVFENVGKVYYFWSIIVFVLNIKFCF